MILKLLKMFHDSSSLYVIEIKNILYANDHFIFIKL